jgi:hypothetical protein
MNVAMKPATMNAGVVDGSRGAGAAHRSRSSPARRNSGSVARRSFGNSFVARLGETSHLPDPDSQVAAFLPTI